MKKKPEINKIELISLEEQIRKELELVNNGKEYSIGIDIVNRSRELSGLYVKVNDIDKSIEIMELMIDFCFNLEPLNNPQFFAQDIEQLILMYKMKSNKKNIKELLQLLIDRYPDSSCIDKWKKQLYNKKKYEL